MFRVCVHAVDVKGKAADASLHIILHDDYGEASEKVSLHNILSANMTPGKDHVFETNIQVKKGLSKVLRRLELWRDKSEPLAQWFVEKVTLKGDESQPLFIFPILRWLKADTHYLFQNADICCPPQDEQLPEQRQIELEETRQVYIADATDPSLPVKAADLPDDEVFSNELKNTFDLERAFEKLNNRLACWSTDSWDSINEISCLHQALGMDEPQGVSQWKEDWYFGQQRLSGCDPTHIRLCTQIPDKLAVTERMLLPMLENHDLDTVISEKRLFIIDHYLLHHLQQCNGRVVCAPIALFFLNSERQLVPIAIQLFQDPGLRNPVFFPNDPCGVWSLAKQWFNNAEAQVHQALTHFTVCHSLMEGICIMSHRHLAENHPIFKLLAPHFHQLITSNKLCREHILQPGGPMDAVLSCGAGGMDTIIRRGLPLWRMDVEGSLPEDLKARGVFGSDVLPGYHYRDDGILVYNAIVAYTTKYINLYYDYEEKIEEDFELQAWASELSKSREDGGLGINGVPGQGRLSTYEHLVQVTASVIFTCTAGHAAVGGRAICEQYAFPPAYPTFMRGAPPSEKKKTKRRAIILALCLQGPRAEEDILQTLPDQHQSALASILSSNLCGVPKCRLGEPRVQYITDPSAINICFKFQEELEEARYLINWRNNKRVCPYTCLNPKSIPNTPFS
ncbi:polyunsaturated fatty acid lipoxygenase ALOX8-like isoform X1 [Haliotis asinina]|uniref:polyunsaturated fatty acid lipoxygenase ALOX8-like isoform X1 n=1 Tax=Haliotis asinina TaxID=109174 RepID=UPI003531E6C4